MRRCALTLLLLAGVAMAQPAATVERSATPAALFTVDEARALARTLPMDREVHFRIHRPASAALPGVLVYVSPTDSGEPPQGWQPVLDEAQLVWIAADGFGNSRPTAERMLVAVMALKLAAQEPVDGRRLYVSGTSGGGRVASLTIAHFPRLFTGALFMVGADYYLPEDGPSRALLASRRLVFLTGNRDFNQREMRRAYRQYHDAGVTRTLLLDDAGSGHGPARPEQLRAALRFLDTR
jgi:poly(3-hydroxybutyrate) depolymerase